MKPTNLVLHSGGCFGLTATPNITAHRAKSTLQSGQAIPTTLHLNLHREFFAQIAAGTKRTEYRAGTPYWRRRLEGRHYDVVQFRNGYATQAPEMLVELENRATPHPGPLPERGGEGAAKAATLTTPSVLRSLRRDKSASVAS